MTNRRVLGPIGLIAVSLLLVGCLGESIPLYGLWVTNDGTVDRVIVLTDEPGGTSPQPGYRVPGDQVLRAAPGVLTKGLNNAVGAADVILYDLDCNLLTTIRVPGSGAFRLDVHADGSADLMRYEGAPPGATDVPVLDESSVRCPGAAPQQ
jgi:hypothetical protein